MQAPDIRPRSKSSETASGPVATSYLAVCAVYRDEARYMREWLEFHRIVGVERFFLYNNNSSDEHAQVLEPYVDAGLVVVHEWPRNPAQLEVYDHCLNEHRAGSRWIAFLDLDEFLFSPTGHPLGQVLSEYEPWPGVGVNRAAFGTSGYDSPPPGLVIENYTRKNEEQSPVNHTIKSIVNPARTVRCLSSHGFEYERDSSAVDEQLRPIHYRTQSVSFSWLRINHYYTKSRQEFERKLDMLTPDWGIHRRRRGKVEENEKLVRRLDAETDLTITAYLPALRQVIARRSH